jgi:DNA-binding transcriptional LysR family regulator
MNLRQIRTFVAVADAGGLARAQARLHLSQPAASRQLQALEDELGAQLFNRLGRSMQLTSEGDDLLRLCRRLLQDADAIGERARALKKGVTGILRVGATPQVIETMLASFLVGYRQRHPGVEVQLVEDGGNNLPARLERGDILLALMAVDDARFEHRLLSPVCSLAVVAKTHKLARRRTLEVAELADEPLLLLRGGFASRDWFEAACHVAHVRPRVLLETAAPHAAIALAGSGYGIAVVPSTVAIPRGRVGVVALVQRGAAVGRWMRIAWDSQRYLAPYAERFIEELTAWGRRNVPQREYLKRAPPLPPPKV